MKAGRKSIGILIRLYRYSEKDFRWLLAALALAFAAVVINSYAPFLISDIVDDIIRNYQTISFDGRITVLIIAVAAMAAISFVLSTFKVMLINRSSINIARKLRSDLIDKIRRVPYSVFLKMRSGDLTSRITNDCSMISQNSGACILTTLTSFITILVVAACMLVMNAELAAVGLVAPVVGLLLTAFLSKRVGKYYLSNLAGLGEANSRIIENISGHTQIKTHCAEGRSMRVFDAVNGKLANMKFKSNLYSNVIPAIMTLASNLGYVLIFIYGIVMASEGRMNFGTVIGLIIFMRLFTQPIADMGMSIPLLKNVEAASVRVFEILDAEEMSEEESEPLKEIKGMVEFKDVHFSYNGDDENIKGISFAVKPGQKVAVIGPSGSGKTTLMNLLMGFFDIDSGDILVDGRSVRTMSQQQLHSLFSMVPQDNWVFEGSYRQNIVYSSKVDDDEKILALCDSIGLAHIRDMPDGLDTPISPKSLSEGEKQQISLARAMLREAPILVLDEATSSIDMKKERLIIEALNKIAEDRTSFIVAHRLSTIRDADMIVVIEGGRVLESGSPQELMEKGGYFRDINVTAEGSGPPISHSGHQDR